MSNGSGPRRRSRSHLAGSYWSRALSPAPATACGRARRRAPVHPEDASAGGFPRVRSNSTGRFGHRSRAALACATSPKGRVEAYLPPARTPRRRSAPTRPARSRSSASSSRRVPQTADRRRRARRGRGCVTDGLRATACPVLAGPRYLDWLRCARSPAGQRPRHRPRHPPGHRRSHPRPAQGAPPVTNTVAVITDIHANLPALEAALARIDELRGYRRDLLRRRPRRLRPAPERSLRAGRRARDPDHLRQLRLRDRTRSRRLRLRVHHTRGPRARPALG